MNRKVILMIGVFATVTLATISYWWYTNQRFLNYIIPGVPPYTIYSEGMNAGRDTEEGRFLSSTVKATLDIVFDYWTGKQGFLQSYPAGHEQETEGKRFLLSELARFARSLGYEATVYQARDVDELRHYINPTSRTPVIVYQSPTVSYTGKAQPFRVVIGLRGRDKKVIVHDFRFGHNYEISYDEFSALWKKGVTEGNFSNHYLVIRPSDWQQVLKDRKLPSEGADYPSRSPIMDQKALWENIMFLAEQVKIVKAPVQELSGVYRKVVDDQNFELMPRWWRVHTYASAAIVERDLGNIDRALSYAKLADSVNSDLNAATDGWSYGWPYFTVSALALINTGDVYLVAGDRDTALLNYQRAREINQTSMQLNEETGQALQGKIRQLGG